MSKHRKSEWARQRSSVAPSNYPGFEETRQQAAAVGIVLRKSSIGRKAEHWMFDCAATGRRYLNYYPSTRRGFVPGNPKRGIDGYAEALKFAIEQHVLAMNGGKPKPTELPEGFDAESAVAAEFAFL